MKRFIWAGPHPQGKQWSRLRDSIESLGVACARKWSNSRDVDDSHKCDFVICATGNPMHKRVCEYAKKKGVLVVFPTGKSFGAVKKSLDEAGLIPESRKGGPANLQGFHDDEKAEVVNPVTHPVLTVDDVKRVVADPVPVWREDGRVRVHTGHGSNTRPIFAGSAFHRSIAEAAKKMGVSSGLLSNRMLRNKKPEVNGTKLRWATFREVLDTIPGAFHDASREKKKAERKKKEKKKRVKPVNVWVEGSMVVTRNPKTGRAQRPVMLDDQVFVSVKAAGDALEVSGGSVTNAIQEGRELYGFKVRYATVDEALTLEGAFRDQARDRDAPRDGFGKKRGSGGGGTAKVVPINVARSPQPAAAAPAVPKHVPNQGNSRLIAAIVDILNDGASDENKMLRIKTLLGFDDEDSKLANALRSAESLVVVKTLVEYELG